MDYTKWGQEYLEEAQNLKRRLAPLRKQLRHTGGKDAVLLMRRLSILDGMYLDCLHSGQYLQERGKRL